jgi:hypothetical protein
MKVFANRGKAVGFKMESQVYIKPKIQLKETSRELFLKSWVDNNVASAINHYKRVKRTKQFTLLPNDYSKLLSSLTTIRTPKMATTTMEIIMNDMIDQKIAIDMRDHHSILAIYYLAKEYTKVIDHFDSLRYQYKLKPDVKSFNYVIASYFNLNNHQKTIQVWNECINSWPCSKFINMDAYSFVLESHGRQKNLCKINELYNTLVKTLKPTQLEIIPNIHEALIRAFGHSNNLQLAVGLFNKVGANKIPAVNSHFAGYYDAIIEACLLNNHGDMAHQYWDHVLDICDDFNQRELQLEPRKTMSKESWKAYSDYPFAPLQYPNYFSPFPITVSRMMEYFFENKEYGKTVEMWMMCKQSMNVNGDCYELAAMAFWELGDYNTSQHVLYEMTQKRFGPKTDIYQKVKEYRQLRKKE